MIYIGDGFQIYVLTLTSDILEIRIMIVVLPAVTVPKWA
jgi:hypothetical protein